MSRCRRSLRATRALCLAKSDQGERRGGGGSGTAGHPAVCCPAPHGKAHFVGFGGLQSAPFGHVAAREVWNQTPRQPAGHYGKWPNWANALEQPPARLRGGLRPSTTSAHGPRDVSGASRGCPWAACRAISTGASIPFASTRQVTDGPKPLDSQRLMTWRGDRSPDARARPSAWG